MEVQCAYAAMFSLETVLKLRDSIVLMAERHLNPRLLARLWRIHQVVQQDPSIVQGHNEAFEAWVVREGLERSLKQYWIWYGFGIAGLMVSPKLTGTFAMARAIPIRARIAWWRVSTAVHGMLHDIEPPVFRFQRLSREEILRSSDWFWLMDVVDGVEAVRGAHEEPAPERGFAVRDLAERGAEAILPHEHETWQLDESAAHHPDWPEAQAATDDELAEIQNRQAERVLDL